MYAYGCTMCRMYNVHCTCFCWAVSDFIIYFFATIWIEDIPPCVCVCACFHALSHCRLFRYWQKKRKRHVIIILINKTIYDKRKKQPHTNICQLLKYFAYTNDSYLFWVHKHDTKKNAAVQFFGCFFSSSVSLLEIQALQSRMCLYLFSIVLLSDCNVLGWFFFCWVIFGSFNIFLWILL